MNLAVDYSEFIMRQWHCASCGERSRVKTPFAIDAMARPDLVNALVNGDLATAACPACGVHAEHGQPILIYLANAAVQLVVVRPMPESCDDELEQTLVAALLDRLGPTSAADADHGGIKRDTYASAGEVLSPYCGLRTGRGGTRQAIRPKAGRAKHKPGRSTGLGRTAVSRTGDDHSAARLLAVDRTIREIIALVWRGGVAGRSTVATCSTSSNHCQSGFRDNGRGRRSIEILGDCGQQGREPPPARWVVL